MLTVLLIILAPLAIVVLPFDLGVAVAVFTILLLVVREWQDAVKAEKAKEPPQDSQPPSLSAFKPSLPPMRIKRDV